jgi:hypothetical protein
VKTLQSSLKMTTGLAIFLSALCVFVGTVTYLAALETIPLLAPIVIWIIFALGVLAVAIAIMDRVQWFRLRRADFQRDQEIAKSAGRTARLEADRYRMRLIFEGRMMAATARQAERGLLHAGEVGGVGMATFPRQVINQIEAIGTTDTQVVELPPQVHLSQLIPAGPSLDSLAIGVEAKIGTLRPVKHPLARLVHIGVGGSSGWGKTVLLQALAIQMVLAPESVELCFVDVEEQSFTPFAGLGRQTLRYPVANDESDILAILEDLRGEWHRRRSLFKKYPEIDNLDGYNKASDSPVPPIVLMIDEINMLTDNKEIIGALTKLGQGTRKYGIFCVMGGQNWNADDIPTKLRNNFSTRIQMRAMSRSQSNVMLADGAAADIVDPGRAFAIIPGHVMTEVQTPYISKSDIIEALIGRIGGTPPVMPESTIIDIEPNTTEAKAVEAFKSLRDGPVKFSWRKATEAAYGPGKFGKAPNEKLRATLDEFGVDYSDL